MFYAGIGAGSLFAGGAFLDFRAAFPGWPAIGLSLVNMVSV